MNVCKLLGIDGKIEVVRNFICLPLLIPDLVSGFIGQVKKSIKFNTLYEVLHFI